MKFTSATVAAAAAFLPSLTFAHLTMTSPASVWNILDGKDQFPLEPNGSNYPCTVSSEHFIFPEDVPTFEPGSAQSIGLKGSAVHGGGSCQVSFTYDKVPNKQSVFRVVKSFQGACPLLIEGNLAPNPENPLPSLPFTVPEDMPAGDAVVAWTWFNRIGNREMYMRCAPVRIGGSNSDKSGFEKLPEIMKANIGNDCETKENMNVKYPNPGPDVVGEGDADSFSGSGCPTSGYVPPVVELPPIEIPSITVPVLVGKPTESAQPEPPVQPPSTTQPPVAQPPTPTTTQAPIQPPKSTPTPPVSAPPSQGTECNKDGAIVCNSATTFSICNFGVLVPMGTTAAGVQCQDGKMVAAKLKRSIRFSSEHVRRRHHLKMI